MRVRISTHPPLVPAQFWVVAAHDESIESLRARISHTLDVHYGARIDASTLCLRVSGFDVCEQVGEVLRDGDLVEYVEMLT